MGTNATAHLVLESPLSLSTPPLSRDLSYFSIITLSHLSFSLFFLSSSRGLVREEAGDL